jgi:hypothetical protein
MEDSARNDYFEKEKLKGKEVIPLKFSQVLSPCPPP